MSTRDVPRTGRAPASLLRGLALGAAALVGLASLCAALTGDGALWTSPLLGGPRVWSALTGLAWLGVVAHALRPLPRTARVALGGALALVTVAAALDVVAYYQLVARAAIATRLALPASAGVLLLAFAAARELARTDGAPRGALAWTAGLAGGATGGVAATLALVLAFGATDYRRPADCAVVLGARVHADGTPSLALADRVAEGVRLYETGLVHELVMSGGVDPGHGRSEARVMAQLAVEAGVPAEHVHLDEAGANTRASAENCARLAAEHGWRDALLVSHGYHLLRAKTAFHRAGLRTYSVPARETRPLRKGPLFVLRECVAWLYYALPA
ncbi:MAG: YdcF family protein [Planctomycetes bacterium]|nr:YdcF family protein [Planctomycetota bacterium]